MSIVDTKSNLSECLLSLMLMSFLLTSELVFQSFYAKTTFKFYLLIHHNGNEWRGHYKNGSIYVEFIMMETNSTQKELCLQMTFSCCIQSQLLSWISLLFCIPQPNGACQDGPIYLDHTHSYHSIFWKKLLNSSTLSSLLSSQIGDWSEQWID